MSEEFKGYLIVSHLPSNWVVNTAHDKIVADKLIGKIKADNRGHTDIYLAEIKEYHKLEWRKV